MDEDVMQPEETEEPTVEETMGDEGNETSESWDNTDADAEEVPEEDEATTETETPTFDETEEEPEEDNDTV